MENTADMYMREHANINIDIGQSSIMYPRKMTNSLSNQRYRKLISALTNP
jgi:hypothetical protein